MDEHLGDYFACIYHGIAKESVILIKFDMTYQKFSFCDVIIQFTGQSSRRGYELAASKNRYASYA